MKKRLMKISLVKELVDFYRFFRRTTNSEKNIVFYSEHKGYYPYFSGLIRELVTKNQKSICYVTSDIQDPILETLESKIKTFYLKKLLPFFMIYVNCKVFVMTLTDLNQFHLKRSINSVHYVYVFHSLISTHMGYLSGAFDHYDSILCVGAHQIEEIRQFEKINGLSPKILIEAGYNRIEEIYQEYQKTRNNISSSDTNKKTILIAPSWGKDNVLEACGEHLVQILLENDYFVIVRPHPETVKRNSELLEVLNSRYSDDPNFTLELSVATNTSLLKADLLICDASGIIMEYAFGTERPVLFLNVPVKIRNPEYKDIELPVLEVDIRSKIGEIIDPDKLMVIPQLISQMIERRNEYKEQIIALREKFIFNFGFSSMIGTKHILREGIDSDEKGVPKNGKK
jgi:CDP-glycerol glycerophosphotransferase (TagB/SpsB family)